MMGKKKAIKKTKKRKTKKKEPEASGQEFYCWRNENEEPSVLRARHGCEAAQYYAEEIGLEDGDEVFVCPRNTVWVYNIETEEEIIYRARVQKKKSGKD